MSELHPFSLSKFFSALIGRELSFALTGTVAPGKGPLIVGEYDGDFQGEQCKGVCVVAADLPLLARLAGALLGLPEDVAVKRALLKPMEEPVRDAIHEVLNVAASAVAVKGRLVFKAMYLDKAQLSVDGQRTFTKPMQVGKFEVNYRGASIGRFTVYSR